MKRSEAWLFIESLPTVISFFVVVSCFPSGGVLTKDGNLVDFWIIPAVFLLVAGFLEKISEDKATIPNWVFFFYSKIAIGVASGLSFGAVLILNEWYANPDNGLWEPLFTATGVSAAGVAAAQRWLQEIRKKSPIF